MKNSLPLISGLALLLLLMQPLRASDPYFVQLTIGDDSRQSEDAAFAEGMRLLLGRLSGDPHLWLQPRFGEMVFSAPSFIERFNYRPLAGESQRRSIRLWYEAEAVNAAMRQRGFVPIVQQPETLVWLLNQNETDSWLVAPDEPGSLYQSLPALGQERGLTLLSPLVDLQERSGFVGRGSEAEVNASLISLSQRYDPGALLIARMRPEMGSWLLTWTRIHQGEHQRWLDQGADLDQLLARGLDQLAGPRPEPPPPPKTQELELAISGLRQGADSQRLQAYLKGLSMVQDLQPLGQQDGWWLAKLQLLGEREALLQTLGFGGLLQQTEAPQAKKPAKPKVQDPLADLSLPGRVPQAKPAAPAPPGRLHFRLLP
ncbi:MAG: DUF2066 domain-containing protein [Gammaproteobacteria bacterium]|nr:DUF2066 domain-containing protein [Gammaproteobacteria bacterium]